MGAEHMSHPYENVNLSFGKMKEMFKDAVKGKLQLVTEKTDGQSLYLSYSPRKRHALGALTDSDILAGGLDEKGMIQRWEEKTHIAEDARFALRDAFHEAWQDWNEAVRLMDPETQTELFGNLGTYYYACEVMNPLTPNVIDYDVKTLLVHRVKQKEVVRYDDGDVKLETVADDEKVQKLESYLNAVVQVEKGRPSYKVIVNKVHILEEIEDQTMAAEAIGSLNKLMGEYDVDDGDPLSSYFQNFVENRLLDEIEEVDDRVKELIMRRIMGEKNNPELHIKNIQKLVPNIEGVDLMAKVKFLLDPKNIRALLKEARKPLEDITHKFAVQYLTEIQTVFEFVEDKEKGSQKLQHKLSDHVKRIRAGVYGHSEADIAKLDDLFNWKIGDTKAVKVASEGIVFEFDGHQYKFTGHFAPINQILGMGKYSRGGEAPLKEHEVEEKKKIFVYPGRFQPMGQHHAETYRQIVDEFNEEGEVYVATSDLVDPPRSPFDFNEKKEIMSRHGIPADRIIQVKNPYNVLELLQQYNPGEVEVTYFVGEKDRMRFGANNRGGVTREGYDWKIEEAPHVSRDIEGFGEMSGTSLRKALERADEERFEEIMGWFDPAIHQMILHKLNTIEEMSGAAAAGGYSMPLGQRRDEEERSLKHEEKGMIQREEVVVEMKLRELIRKRIKKQIKESKREGIIYINDQQRVLLEQYQMENALRHCIRKIILQEKTEPVPHANTGINQLSDLLKKIVPILSRGFKSLTTKLEQRTSYRSHVLRNVISALAPLQADDNAVPEALTEEDEDIEITLDDPRDNEKFIDIEDPTGEKAAAEEEEESFEVIPGQDLTGRNKAQTDFDRIERIIMDSYEVLGDEVDQDLFYDYLITNLKLYFDKFETELGATAKEPTTPEYEEEKAQEAEFDAPAPEAVEDPDALQEDAVSKARSEKNRRDSRHTGNQKNTYNKAVRRQGKSDAQNAKLKWTNPDALDGEENLDEVYSDKQRKWACANMDDKPEVAHMCTDPMKK